MNPNRELDLFNAGYDLKGDESGLAHTFKRILSGIARPDRQKAINLAKAGFSYYQLESDCMDDGARLPYRPR